MEENRLWRARSIVAALAVATFALGLAACGDESGDDTGGGDSEESKSVTFALGFSPNYGQAPFFAALLSGMYEDAGLNVDYVVPDSTQTAAKLVGVGKADFGEFFGLDPVTAAGEGIPTQVVATWAWGDLGLMVDPDNGEINSVADLEGKTLGTFSGLPYSEACRPRLLEANGLSEDDVETVDIGFNSVTPLLTGKVDASEGGDPAETVTYEIEKGQAPKYFPYSEACAPFLFGVFTNRDWAADNPETASAFIDATMQGAKLASEDPAEVHRLFTKEFSDLEQPLLQFERFGEAICGPDAASEGLGYNDQQAYEDLIQLGQDEDMIKSDVPYDDVVTDDYLPDEPVMSSACK